MWKSWCLNALFWWSLDLQMLVFARGRNEGQVMGALKKKARRPLKTTLVIFYNQ